MQITQTRTHKSKATSKSSERSAIPAKGAIKRAAETGKDATPTITAEERQRLIARVAYFRAEKRGFAPGCELQDWVEAEAEVLRLIGKA